MYLQNVQCTLYTVHILQCKFYSVKCTMYTCKLYSIHCVQCTLYTVYNIQGWGSRIYGLNMFRNIGIF